MKIAKNTFALLFILVHFTYGQTDFTKERKNEFLNDLVTSFKTEFLWEEKGIEIAKKLNSKINKGAYEDITDPELFVSILNRDLYKFSHDLHLKIGLNRPASKTSSITNSKSYFFISKKEPEEGIYYLKFDEFPELTKSLKAEISEFMSSLTNPKAIIIDLRDNSGGSDMMVNHLAGYFFPNKKMLATSYQWNTPPQEIWAVPKLQSKELSKVKLIILTSQATFSAAELFTQRLQLHNRAQVVGEPTPGGAHRTMTYLMSDIFLLHWPYEKSLHAATLQDLEGIGVKPDYPAHYQNAFQTALKLIGSGGKPVVTDSKMPKQPKLVRRLVKALNSYTVSAVENFLSKHVVPENQEAIAKALTRFNKVWNPTKDALVANLHFISENQIRLFVKSQDGTNIIKLVLNDANQISKILIRS
nr:S41 family peptidase [Allomuricauda sp.]